MKTERLTLALRIAALVLLATFFGQYALYSHRFHLAFMAQCNGVYGANLNAAPDGVWDGNVLYGFVIAAAPAMLASARLGLPIVVGLCLFANCCALPSLTAFRTFTDCGVNSGNTEDFTGDYLLFYLGYALLVLMFYLVVLTELAASGVRTLHCKLLR